MLFQDRCLNTSSVALFSIGQKGAASVICSQNNGYILREKTMSKIHTIGVIGAGQMGAGIAHVAAMSGFNVILTDISRRCTSAGSGRIEKNMRRV